MESCPFCVKAEQLFSDELKNGSMEKKPSSEAPKGVNGFPTFLNTETGKMSAGLPSSKKELFQKLGVSSVKSVENFSMSDKTKSKIVYWIIFVLISIPLAILLLCLLSSIFGKRKNKLKR